MTVASRPCPTPRCPRLQPCDAHPRVPFANAQRSTNLYGTARWRQERREYLALHPLCVECVDPATVVDHVTPHRGDVGLFWAQGNWQALCAAHHNAKTGRETRERVGVKA